MADIGALTREVVDLLTAAGITATADPRDLNPPGVLVGPPSFEPHARLAGITATYTLWAVVPNAGVQEFGWPARNIPAQPYATVALENTQPAWAAAYLAELDAIIGRIHGLT